MSYQVIARKYRPRRFSEVVGQEHVTQTLANAITQQRIAHAYLFVGPRGTGKTTIARIFAKCLNCTGGPAVDFPDDDPKAREIAEGRSMDVLEIDGASNRGIEEIRELRETVKYVPASSKFKIYIIDEVHMLTKEAFNALLKTLEEPPEHVKFMFATTEPEKVLPTILSRCQRFDLRRIPAGLIVKHLSEIAGKENVEIDDAALYAVARGAEGGMRDAESTLDQLISFCGNKIQEPDVLSMFGLAARAQLLSLASAILQGAAAEALRELNDLAKNGKDLSRLLTDLLSHFRNLMIFQYSKGDPSLLDVSEAEAAALAAQSAAAPPESITRIMEVLAEAEGRLREAASKKIFLEITLLKSIEARNTVSIDTVLKKLRQLRGESSGGTAGSPTSALPAAAPSPVPAASVPMPAAPAKPAAAPFVPAEAVLPPSALPPQAPAPQPPPVKPATPPEPAYEFRLSETAEPAPSPAPAPQAAAEPAADLEALWSELIEAVGRSSPFLKAYLIESHPVAITANTFTLGFDPVFADHLAYVEHAKNRVILETKLREMGRPVAVRVVKAETPPHRPHRPRRAAAAEAAPQTAPAANPAPRKSTKPATASAQAPAPASLSKEDFKNDPLIKKALEIFKGTIVEVRS